MSTKGGIQVFTLRHTQTIGMRANGCHCKTVVLRQCYNLLPASYSCFLVLCLHFAAKWVLDATTFSLNIPYKWSCSSVLHFFITAIYTSMFFVNKTRVHGTQTVLNVFNENRDKFLLFNKEVGMHCIILF